MTEDLKLVAFDPAAYLDDPADVVGYLQSAFTSRDPLVIMDAFGMVARSGGMAKLAARGGLCEEDVDEALRAGADLRFSTVLKLTKAMGIELVPTLTSKT